MTATKHYPHRIADLSPFEATGSYEYLPPGRPYLADPNWREELVKEVESAYGCVDWYQYARLRGPTHNRAPSD